MSSKVKKQVALPFPVASLEQAEQSDVVHNQVRPKAQQYADRTWPAPRNTRRSMGKR
ncbi:hypothetical protein [Acinetobacter boissieri]|uniref:Uncharacterized protein n=1 Tax=Acinetobacter boissieri TaxID=1219383 RepID=A0A1G6IVQ3_9GAMM|nr:hypothetical protein [Acinetobacter boissieri]SDC10587.1 hypothetical protein SAMN05421733_10962 [Acinetobacter boissieri]